MTDTAPASYAVKESPRGSGPIVWASIIATTCLLLFFFQKILWLVVPFLLALILYYLLYPSMQALIYRGMSREAAASVVTLGFLVLLSVVGVMLSPWVTSHIAGWQDAVIGYVQGGLQLLDRSLRTLEAHWGPLARAHLADTVAGRLTQGAGSVADHLEPIAVGIMAWAPSLMLAPFLAFFFLRDGRRFQRFLGGAVPNAFFEKTLYLLHEIDRTSRAYFQGLIKLTVLDTLTLAAGLWLLGIPGPFALGLICAVLAWVPYVGSILGGLLVVLVAATDFPDAPTVAYWAIALFVVVRLLDDFVYMPLTIGKSLELHPLVTVLMIFVGGAVAGISGLMLVLPVLGVVMVIGETIGVIVTDPRLMARHRHARALRREQASSDL
ncbi:MAG: AI-2E family transporter [Sulfuritalea sp.]|jgi:predicted PurR-regulated permease PerM|nr:AI-2E family transporter [Sulfuritalea sp.]